MSRTAVLGRVVDRVLTRAGRAPEAVAYGLVTLLGAGFVATSFGYGLRTDDGWIGPGFLPLVVGGLLVLLSAAELTRCLRASGRPAADGTDSGDAADDEGTDIFGRTEAQRVRQLWTVAAAILVTVLVVPLLGLPVAFGALVFFISTWVERRPLRTAVVITAVSITVVHVVFVTLLGVPLPGGLVGLGA